MLMIRFQRIGRRNDPAFRIVVTEKTRGPRAGRYVDLVGTYNPKTKATALDGESIKKWIANGAQVSPSLKNLLITKEILTGKKINVLPRKQPIKSDKKEEKETEAVPAVNDTADEKSSAGEPTTKEETVPKEAVPVEATA